MKTFCLIILLLTLCSCEKNRHALPRLNVESHGSVRILNSKIMLRSQLPLLAVNFTTDTTTFTDLQDMQFYTDHFNDTSSISYDQKENDIRIIIDTSYNFSNRGFEYRNIEALTEKEKQTLLPKGGPEKTIFKRYFKQTDSLRRQYLKSYPVLIYNNSASDIDFGSQPIKIIQEALDIDNIWKPIEFTYERSRCGIASSMIHFRVKPKHYLATAVVKYTGDFRTKIRLNYLRGSNVFYSNEITGYINRTQFDPKPAENYLQKVEPTSAEWMIINLSWMFHKPVQY